MTTLEPVDLRGLLDSDPPDEDWSIEPVAPAGRATFIHAPRGEGKSLLLLDMVAATAAGISCLDRTPQPPRSVIYIDQEMGIWDLYDRLVDLGYRTSSPDFDVLEKHLHYYQGIALPALDTPRGGEALSQLVNQHQGEIVVIDTLGRVTDGEENSNDTYRSLARHTMTRLRKQGVTLLVLDHTGKDASKGARGASAKGDLADVQWSLTRTGTRITLKLTKGRQHWVPSQISVDRLNLSDRVVHRLTPIEVPPEQLQILEILDELRVPIDASKRQASEILREAGRGRRISSIAAALKMRRETHRIPRLNPGPTPGPTPY